jgi:hypothetical protein
MKHQSTLRWLISLITAATLAMTFVLLKHVKE